MRDLRKEVFKVLLLNRANRLIKEVTISEGTLEASIVHPQGCLSRGYLGTCGRDHSDPQSPEWKSEPQRRGSPDHQTISGGGSASWD